MIVDPFFFKCIFPILFLYPQMNSFNIFLVEKHDYIWDLPLRQARVLTYLLWDADLHSEEKKRDNWIWTQVSPRRDERLGVSPNNGLFLLATASLGSPGTALSNSPPHSSCHPPLALETKETFITFQRCQKIRQPMFIKYKSALTGAWWPEVYWGAARIWEAYCLFTVVD